MNKGLTYLTGMTILSCVLLCLAGCLGKAVRKEKVVSATVARSFPPLPQVPAVITDPAAAAEYVASTFWDAFLNPSAGGLAEGGFDTSLVAGVPKDEVESALSSYLSILEERCSKPVAVKCCREFFAKVESYQRADSASNVFAFFEKMMEKYLYDPNSPFRDEDIYQPYVAGLAVSPFVEEDFKWSYEHTAQMCLLNQVGTRASDIDLTYLDGKRGTLYSVKAPWTLLFFSNPLCTACKEIVDQLEGSESVSSLIEDGTLAVVNVYIDSELDKWRDYAVNYPKEWHTAYDRSRKVRTAQTYDVRAIPSLYLLDKDKTVLMKDAPTERVIPALENIAGTRDFAHAELK